MTAPDCTDPAIAPINMVITIVKLVFDPNSDCPPIGGGSTNVRFFTWSGAPLAAWDAHMEGSDCSEPFLWVRIDSRFRSTAFPGESVDAGRCKGQRVMALEIGVGRCSELQAETDWKAMANEAEISLDDSWRIEKILCAASTKLDAEGYSAATDTIVPYGPEGGITAWSGLLYVGF